MHSWKGKRKPWRVAIVKDTSRPMFGLHGLHVAFRGLPDVRVVALVDANTDHLDDKLQVMQAQRHYRTCQAMLEHETPDIVVICSRHPDDHLPQIRQVASRGCHIYCEKPLAATLEEADEIVRLAQVHGIQIAMAHPARHMPAFRTMRRMIDAGEIGMPLTIHGRGKSDHRGGGEDLIVLGTHMLDIMLCLRGPTRYVWADMTQHGRPIQANDRLPTTEPVGPCAADGVWAMFGFADGVRGVFESHRGVFGPGASRGYMGVTVTGSQGALSVRFEDARDARPSLRLFPGPCAPEAGMPSQEAPLTEDREIPGAMPLEESLCRQPDVPNMMFLASNRWAAWDLMQAIDQHRPPIASAQDARCVQEMIQGIYASHLEGRRLTFPLHDRRHPLLAGPIRSSR